MHNKRTDAEIIAILRAIKASGSVTAAAEAAGKSASNYRQARLEAKQRGLTAETKISDPLASAKIEIGQLRRDLLALQRETDTAEKIRQEIYNLAAKTPEPPTWLTKPGKAGFRGVPCTIWSDWHYGEVVQLDEAGGANQFNAEIAAKRVKKLVSRTIDLSFNHMGRAKTSYPGIVCMLGGDMISGDIHEELLATNDRTPYQCVNDLVEIIAAGLTQLADAFGNVFVPCVVGNHGRGTRKPRMKGRVYTSFEWNIYCMLERHFRVTGDKRVQFFIPNESDAYFKVYGHRYLLTHGDSLGVKGGDGIIGAIGPIMRGSIKVGNSEAQIGREFDTIVMGHWHQMLWLPGAIVNNSLKGYDEFARLALRAPYSRPSQALWFTHPEHGITARWEVFLEGRANVTEDRTWVQWAQ